MRFATTCNSVRKDGGIGTFESYIYKAWHTLVVDFLLGCFLVEKMIELKIILGLISGYTKRVELECAGIVQD